MMLTTLLRALQIMDLKLAGTVHLKVDGGSEIWNSTVLAVLDLLFDMYPELKEIVVSRFGAGHTHADLDRIYGYLNQVLFGISPGGHRAGRNIYSREEFFQLLEQALQTSKDTALLAMMVEDLLFTFDFKSLVALHLYSEFKGHGSSGQIHVFRFRRVDGSPQSASHLVQVLAPISDLASCRWIFSPNSQFSAGLARCEAGQGEPVRCWCNEGFACAATEALALAQATTGLGHGACD